MCSPRALAPFPGRSVPAALLALVFRFHRLAANTAVAALANASKPANLWPYSIITDFAHRAGFSRGGSRPAARRNRRLAPYSSRSARRARAPDAFASSSRPRSSASMREIRPYRNLEYARTRSPNSARVAMTRATNHLATGKTAS
jgi:hypothetical protein|tara:strand:- start:213 stop:647 length:435 start_codon:yes stop_codon:yes gene_type:complete